MCTTIKSAVQHETETLGIHHLGLTVPNLEQTLDFFTDVLAYKKVGEKPEYPAVFISDGHTMLTLWQAKDSEPVIPFNRSVNIGLHHFAIKLKNKAALVRLYKTLELRNDVEIEFSPEPLSNGPVEHMMCFIPGGLRVEFIALPE